MSRLPYSATVSKRRRQSTKHFFQNFHRLCILSGATEPAPIHLAVPKTPRAGRVQFLFEVHLKKVRTSVDRAVNSLIYCIFIALVSKTQELTFSTYDVEDFLLSS